MDPSLVEDWTILLRKIATAINPSHLGTKSLSHARALEAQVRFPSP